MAKIRTENTLLDNDFFQRACSLLALRPPQRILDRLNEAGRRGARALVDLVRTEPCGMRGCQRPTRWAIRIGVDPQSGLYSEPIFVCSGHFLQQMDWIETEGRPWKAERVRTG